MEDVRAEAAVAVASTLVDKVHQERKSNAAKIVKYPPPPPFIRAVLLVQAFVRRRAFLRSFGGVGAGDNVDEEILELAPPKPMMSIALNFVRRLKSFRWVNIEREATLVAGLVDAQAANITMRDVSAVVNYYQDKVPSDHLSLNVLQEALDRQVIVAKEALQERASKLTSPAAIVEAMEQVITDFQVPPEREDRVLDQTRIRLKRIVAEAEETIRKMLAESSSTPSIDAVAARFKRDFGPVASVVEEELKVARIRRVQFLEMELETRWSRPFAGPLPPHSRAARRYELELGKKNPKVIAFVTEEARHAATLEADFEVELSDLRAKVRDLTQKRMEARARSLIQDFDEKLADAAAQVQEGPEFMMGTEPCATLKALVEHSWQGLARSTRRALRNAPQFACESMWAADSLIGELLNHPGLWEHHLGAEMMSRAYAMPPDVGYRERTPALPARVPVEAPAQVRREERLGAESLSTQSSEISESDWTILAEDAEMAEIEMA